MRRLIFGFAAALLVSGVEVSAQTLVEFPSTDQHITGGQPTQIAGILRKPQRGDGPFPAVVGLHGCAGLYNEQGEERGIQRQWGRLLVNQGYVVLMVDGFRPRRVGNACGTGEQSVSPTSVRPYDAYGALRYLQARGDVDPKRIGLLGWSHGGGATVHTMRAEFAAGQEPFFRAAAALYPGSCNSSWLGNYKTAAPLVVMIGESDNWTPPRPCADVMNKAIASGQPIEFVLYPDAVHGFDAENQPITALQGIMGPGRAAPLIGTNPHARDDSRKRVIQLFERVLKAN